MKSMARIATMKFPDDPQIKGPEKTSRTIPHVYIVGGCGSCREDGVPGLLTQDLGEGMAGIMISRSEKAVKQLRNSMSGCFTYRVSSCKLEASISLPIINGKLHGCRESPGDTEKIEQGCRDLTETDILRDKTASLAQLICVVQLPGWFSINNSRPREISGNYKHKLNVESISLASSWRKWVTRLRSQCLDRQGVGYFMQLEGLRSYSHMGSWVSCNRFRLSRHSTIQY